MILAPLGRSFWRLALAAGRLPRDAPLPHRALHRSICLEVANDSNGFNRIPASGRRRRYRSSAFPQVTGNRWNRCASHPLRIFCTERSERVPCRPPRRGRSSCAWSVHESMNPAATSPLKSRRRTLQGVLRERLPQIEAALRAGYRMRTIVEQLAQEGFHTTLGAFRNGLYRARLWRKTHGPLNLPPGDPASVTPASHVEGPPPRAVPKPRPAAPVLTPEDLRKRAGFQYEGTANLNKDDLV